MSEHDNNCFNLVCIGLLEPVGILVMKKRSHFNNNIILTKEEFRYSTVNVYCQYLFFLQYYGDT